MRTRQLVLSFVSILAFSTGCVSDDGGADSSLLVSNQSDFAITEIYLTDINDPDWGPNLIGGDVLLPGEELLLDVSCGTYDALVVDEDDVECTLEGIDLCLNDADWIIRNNTCPVFSSAAATAHAAR